MNTTFKKRSFSLFLSFLLILCSLPFAVFTASAEVLDYKNPFTHDNDPTGDTKANPFDENTGKGYDDLADGKRGLSAEKPFVLDSLHDLDVLASIVNGPTYQVTSSTTGGNPVGHFANNAFDCEDYYFKVANDIGAEGSEFKNMIGWCDNGFTYYFFNGSFDGAEHSIWVKIEDGFNVGLFGNIGSSASVANVNVYGTVSGSHAGGVCEENQGSIANCFSYCTTVKADYYAGGVCGYNKGSIANCFSSCGKVSGTNAGGVCGGNEGGGSIANCFSYCSTVSGTYAGGVCGWNNSKGSIAYCYYDSTVCSGVGKAIGGGTLNTDNVLGLPHEQCVAASGADVSKVANAGTIDGMSKAYPLIDLLNAYVKTYNNQSFDPPKFAGTLLGDTLTIDESKVIDPSKLKGIKLRYWDKQTGDYYPHLSKASEAEPLTSVNVNMFIAKPAIGCRLLRAKAFSKTANVNVTNVRTTWFDGTHRITTKAHLGGKYTAMVSFKLNTAEEYDIADNAKIWVRLNGKLVRATKRGNTYTVMCSFKKLSICNVLSDIYKNLFWRIF